VLVAMLKEIKEPVVLALLNFGSEPRVNAQHVMAE
jgi:hypothetical protein